MNARGLIREETCACASPSDTVALYTRASCSQLHKCTQITRSSSAASASAPLEAHTHHQLHPIHRGTYGHLQRTARHSKMSRHVFLAAATLLAIVCVADAQRRLALPDPRSCANRVRHSTYRDARGVLHSYFFSWEHAPTRNLEVDWLDARNICRRHCMDAVSMETPQENEFIKQRIARGNVRYIWTSGRKCNFAGCDRGDLQPPNVNGWFWSGSGAKIGPTTQRNTGDWSYTGGYGQAQPDNREAAQGNDESCLSILNNFYNDGIKWHDVACHHVKPFVCEDSDELLNFVRSRNPTLRL